MSLKKNLDETNKYIIYGILLAIQSGVFFVVANYRLVDGDEGYYLLAAELVSEGKTLYADFFYPQMPLLPYVYGFWMKLFGPAWQTARLLSGIFAISIGFLLYFHILQVTQKKLLALLAVAVYVSSSFAIGWYTVAKTYALSTLLLFASYAVVCSNRPLKWKYLWGGLLLGLAVDTRLYVVGIIPAFLIYMFWYEKKPRVQTYQLLWFGIGLGAALFPNLFLILENPGNYIFNNLGYHAMREDHGFLWTVAQKIGITLKLAGVYKPEGGAAAQSLILLLLNACLFIFGWSRGNKLPFSVWFTAILFMLFLLPTPSYAQYFAGILPFLILNAVVLVAKVKDNLTVEREKFWYGRLRVLLLVILVPYFLAWPLEYLRYTSWNRDISGAGLWAEAANWKISTIKSVTQAIDKRVGSGEGPVISWWPGYLVGSNASIFPGMENHFGMDISAKLSQNERNKLHLVTLEKVYAHIREHDAPLVVLGNWAWDSVKIQARKILLENGYTMVETIADAEIYQLTAKALPPAQKKSSPLPP